MSKSVAMQLCEMRASARFWVYVFSVQRAIHTKSHKRHRSATERAAD